MKHLVLFLLLLGSAAHSAMALEVKAVNGDQVEIQVGLGETIEAGKKYYIVDKEGKKRGILQCEKVEGEKATAKILKGTATPSWTAISHSDYVKSRPAAPTAKKAAPVYPELSNNAPGEVWNFEVSPLRLILPLGWIELGLTRRMGKQWGLGAMADYLSLTVLGWKLTYYAVGVTGIYKFASDLFEDGFYGGAGLFYASSSYSVDLGTFGNASTTLSGTAVKLRGGYQWVWDSMNLSLGGYYIASSLPTEYSETKNGITTSSKSRFYSGGEFFGEIYLGWTF